MELHKTLKFKIILFLIISGIFLIISIFFILYNMNLSKSKDFYKNEIQKEIKILKNKKDNEIINLLSMKIMNEPCIRYIKYGNKLFKGQDIYAHELLHYSNYLHNKPIEISYSTNIAKFCINDIGTKIYLIMLIVLLLILVFNIYFNKIVKPFNEILNFCQNYSKKQCNFNNTLIFKSKKPALEFTIIKNAINNIIKSIKEYQIRLESMAFIDDVTGLYNRTKFQKDKENRIIPYSLLFIDLDDFKIVNDSLGQLAGDQVLNIIGKRLSGLCDSFKDSIVYRFGGDEFIIIMDIIDKNLIEERVKKIIKIISLDIEIYEEIINFSSSIGITIIENNIKERDGLLEADIAMHYVKKMNHKTYYVFFKKSMLEENLKRIKLLKEIKQATLNKEFIYYFQPQINTKGEIVGVEALIRWKKPDGTLLSPFFFIDILENSKYSFIVFNYLMEDVFKLSKEFPNIKFSVNLAEKQILCPDFLPTLKTIMHRTGVNPKQIEFEILETWKNIDDTKTIETLLELRKIGFSLAIDDFGEDGSSFKRTDLLPISKLKIDKSFVDRLLLNKNTSKNSIYVIVQYANLSQLEIIAEGVETEKQKELLEELGINCFQGFYFYKPLSLNDFKKLSIKQNSNNANKEEQ